jgi:hypothetical protein
MIFPQPVTELIRQRYSCRNYVPTPVEENQRRALADFIAHLPPGPFAGPARFQLVAATTGDSSELRGLGTYGFIRGKPGFIIGATCDGSKTLEDFGFQLERIILYATSLGLGTCWMGGSFTRSSFARKIQASGEEIIPAVSTVGPIAQNRKALDQVMRRAIGSWDRLSWDALFLDGRFGKPLTQDRAGAYAVPLEMVRIAPSASNKQPWRILHADGCWHFYLKRTPGYREAWLSRLIGVVDIQRVDMGIGMCHFGLVAEEAGLRGKWGVNDPHFEKPDELTEYVATWSTN